MSRWKMIAAVQRACAALPGGASLYHCIQRSIGAYRRGIDMTPYLRLAAQVVARMRDQSIEISGARILEVGTGYGLGMPLAFYLCGAECTYTFDLHRYLRPRMVMRSLRNLEWHSVEGLLAGAVTSGQLRDRLARIRECKELDELLSITRIEYRAPADAACTGLPQESVDLHFSFNVFEHIPRGDIERILLEADRVLAPRGAALHRVNPADHFGRYDRSITTINFLQFSDAEWHEIAGNQFAYHNRMRAPEYREILHRCGHDLLRWEQTSDDRAKRALESGFTINPAFRKYSTEDLSVHLFEVLSRPRRAAN